jgi:AraC-like DNA-binding protein
MIASGEWPTLQAMALIEAAARGGAEALLLLIAIQSFREAGGSWAGRAAGLFAFCAGAYVAVSSFFLGRILALWMLPLRMLAFGGPCLFWIWASALFDDDFEPRRRHPLTWIALVALGCVLILTLSWIANLAYNLLALALILLGLRQALMGRGTDLIEPRRRFRLAVTIGIGVYSVAITIAELTAHVALVSPPASTVNALGLLVMAFVFAATRAAWLAPAIAAPPSPRLPSRPPSTKPPDPQEAALLAALRQMMAEDKAYREEGFSLTTLALRLGLPEYRLRRLINQRLGHRNFTDFINSYRLTEALAALADPTQAAVPILTIALDAGFQSIGPFNRAFKARTGMTPTEYRRQRLSELQPAKA